MSAADDIQNITLTNTPLDDRNKMAEAAELFRAIGLATSAVGHFACPSARSNLAGTPSYTGGIWSVPAKCA